MVNSILRIALAGLALQALQAVPAFAAVTADQLRALSEEKAREQLQKKGRVNSGELGELVPMGTPKSGKYTNGLTPEPERTPPGGPKEAASGASKATENPRGAERKQASPAATARPPATQPAGANFYTPPPREASAETTATGITSDAVAPSNAFGVRLGTWIPGSLQRNTTSAETGSVELVLTSSVVGTRRTLPAGTTVFADKVLNSLTKRMELVVTRGITPSGQEFEMRGLVFDPRKTPGLAGIFILDKKQVATSGATKGAIAAVGAAVGSLAGGVGSEATRAATQSVLSDVGQAGDFNSGQQAVIYVSPQELLIRVEAHF